MSNADVIDSRAVLMQLFGPRSPLAQFMTGMVAAANAMGEQVQRWVKAHPAEAEALLKLARELQAAKANTEATEPAPYRGLLDEHRLPQLDKYTALSAARVEADADDDESDEPPPTPANNGGLLN